MEFNRKDRIDVFAKDQYKLQQNSRYSKEISVAELERLQRLKPELKHFLELFFGFDRDDFTEQDIAELDERLRSFPDRLKICKSKRPNLAETFMSLRTWLTQTYVSQVMEGILAFPS